MKKIKGISLLVNEMIKFFSGNFVMILLVITMLIAILPIFIVYNTDIPDDDGTLDSVISQLQVMGDNEQFSTNNNDEYNHEVSICRYMVDNNVLPPKTLSISSVVKELNIYFPFFMIIIIIGAGKIFADEYTKGTIMSYFSRPLQRWKVYCAKYITALCFAITVIIVSLIVSVVVSGFMFGFEGLSDHIVYYDEGVKCDGVLLYVLKNNLYNMISVLGITSMVALGAILLENGLFATCIGSLLYFMGSSVVLNFSKYNILKYVLLSNVQFQITRAGTVLFEGMTNTFSIVIVTIHCVVFSLISVILYEKRNIG